MQHCQTALRWIYYCSTLPYRRATAARLCHRQAMPLMILFYHRVADVALNGWTMRRAMFRQQMDWLAAHFEFISLDRLMELMAAGKNSRPRIHVTFDDGYQENCEFALPLLFQRQIPFTYFVASRHVMDGRPFPHDIRLGRSLPPNTVDQLRWIVRQGGTVGAHTRSHFDCGRYVSTSQLHEEIAGSKCDLEELLDVEINYFAFPYGQPENLPAAALEVAQQAGFHAICSACGGYNFPGDDGFHLRRIHGDPVTLRWKNWLTLDPRKLRQPTPRASAAAPASLAAEVP